MKKNIFSVEEKILGFFRNNILWILFMAVTIIGAVIRYCVFEYVSQDIKNCLLPWYYVIQEGGFTSLSTQTGNYSLFFQFLIAVMTYIPIRPIIGYKMISVIFDYVLAGAVGTILYSITDKKRKYFVAGYAFILLLPTIFLNSACWGQCDAIYVSFVLLAFVALKNNKVWPMFAFLGLGFCFKLQTIFIIPFFLFLYFYQKKFSALYFLLIPLEMMITSIPAYLQGRFVKDTFLVYIGQTSQCTLFQMNYPGFLGLFTNSGIDNSPYFDSIKNAFILFTIAILLAMCVYWINRKVIMTYRNCIYMAFLSSYACVLFLPCMHERYGFLYEILGIIVLFYNRKTVFSYITLIMMTLMTYGNYLFGLRVPVNYWLSCINIAIFCSYMVILNKDMIRRDEVPVLETE